MGQSDATACPFLYAVPLPSTVFLYRSPFKSYRLSYVRSCSFDPVPALAQIHSPSPNEAAPTGSSGLRPQLGEWMQLIHI
jgi:hypothetical protein